MSASVCTTLHDAYFAYRAEVHRSALQEIEGLVDESKYRQHRAAVRAVWRELFASED
jgi:glutamine synthetase adenylyltransferase